MTVDRIDPAAELSAREIKMQAAYVREGDQVWTDPPAPGCWRTVIGRQQYGTDGLTLYFDDGPDETWELAYKHAEWVRVIQQPSMEEMLAGEPPGEYVLTRPDGTQERWSSREAFLRGCARMLGLKEEDRQLRCTDGRGSFLMPEGKFVEAVRPVGKWRPVKRGDEQ